MQPRHQRAARLRGGEDQPEEFQGVDPEHLQDVEQMVQLEGEPAGKQAREIDSGVLLGQATLDLAAGQPGQIDEGGERRPQPGNFLAARHGRLPGGVNSTAARASNGLRISGSANTRRKNSRG